MQAKERWLVYLLRFGGVLLSTAFLAMLLPDAWMAAIHRGLGLGDYPDVPLTSYLSRSLSALYAFHGALLLALSTDVRRFRPLVVFFGWANLVFGVAMTAIDLAAPLPLWWTLGEGPWIVLTGGLILWLAAAVPGEQSTRSPETP